MKRFQRILHATDFSEASTSAFRMALDLARRDRGELSLVHVLHGPLSFVEDDLLTSRALQQLQKATRQGVEKRLETMAARAKRAGVRVSARVLQGAVSAQIAREARRKRVNLLVIGTHGRTGFARAFMGSVAEQVVGLAPCPVLTVRGR